MLRCRTCGTWVEQMARYCTTCGKSLDDSPAVPAQPLEASWLLARSSVRRDPFARTMEGFDAPGFSVRTRDATRPVEVFDAVGEDVTDARVVEGPAAEPSRGAMVLVQGPDLSQFFLYPEQVLDADEPDDEPICVVPRRSARRLGIAIAASAFLLFAGAVIWTAREPASAAPGDKGVATSTERTAHGDPP